MSEYTFKFKLNYNANFHEERGHRTTSKRRSHIQTSYKTVKANYHFKDTLIGE